MLVDDGGEIAFDDFSSADASGEQYWRDRDDAALLVLTAQLVGDDRAIAADGRRAREGTCRRRSFRWCSPRRCRRGLTKGSEASGKALK